MSLKVKYRRLLTLFILMLSISNLLAAEKKDTVDDNSFIKRVSIHTNALNWFLTVPNIGIEYDFLNTPENRFSVLLQGMYNWNTSHTMNPRYVLNVSNISLEFRKYWRTGGTARGAFSKYETRDTTISRVRWFFKKFRRNVLSGRTLTNPRSWRAYYVGLYAGYDQYSLAWNGKGIQGNGINIGISGGWSVPLFLLKNGHSIDLDLGLTIGAKATQYDRYRYIDDTGCYAYTETRDFHVTPYPVIHQIKIGLAYRFRSIAKKVQGGPERYDKWDNLQTALREKRRAEQDSLLQVRMKKQMQRDSVKQEKEKLKEQKKKEKEEQKKIKEKENSSDSTQVAPNNAEPKADQSKRKSRKERKRKNSEEKVSGEPKSDKKQETEDSSENKKQNVTESLVENSMRDRDVYRISESAFVPVVSH